MDPSPDVVSADARSDWRLAFAATGVAGTGSLIFLIIDLSGVGVRPAESVIRLVHLLLMAVTALLLWKHRHRPTRRFCTIAAVVVWLPFFAWLWLSEETLVLAGRRGYSWQPFVGHKVLFFATAALFPGPAWVGAGMLVALGLHAILLWFHLGLGTPAAKVPFDEPWATMAYVAIALVLYGYRLYHGHTERELARVRAEARALKMTTDAFLVVHDLTNTPLQVLELAIALLCRRHVGDDAIMNSAIHALARLRALRDQLPVSKAVAASLEPDALRRLQSAAWGDEPSPDDPRSLRRLTDRTRAP